MLAVEVSHDIIAALVGGLALIIVATVPLLWRRVEASKERSRADRVDMIALRERMDEVLRVALQAHERRAAESERIIERLEDIAEMLSAMRNGKGAV